MIQFPAFAYGIRGYTHADTAACLRVMNAATDVAGFSRTVAASIKRDLAQADLSTRVDELLVATYNSELVGTAGYVIDNGRTANILLVNVDPMLHRRGLGRALLNAVERRATRAGAHKFTLSAYPTAVPFYISQGYQRGRLGLVPIEKRFLILPTFSKQAEHSHARLFI